MNFLCFFGFPNASRNEVPSGRESHQPNQDKEHDVDHEEVYIHEDEEGNNINKMHNFNDVISQKPVTLYLDLYKEIERELKKKEPVPKRQNKAQEDDDLDADFLHKDSEQSPEDDVHRTSAPTVEGTFHVIESQGYHGNPGNDNSYMDKSGMSHH